MPFLFAAAPAVAGAGAATSAGVVGGTAAVSTVGLMAGTTTAAGTGMTAATAAQLAAMAVGTGISVLGAEKQARAQEQAAKYNEDVATSMARQAKEEATFKANAERTRQLRFRSKQEAQIAKTGTTMSGSNLDILADQAFMDEMNLLTIKYGGASMASQAINRANLFSMEADNASNVGDIKALSSIVKGTGQIASAYGKTKIANEPKSYEWE